MPRSLSLLLIVMLLWLSPPSASLASSPSPSDSSQAKLYPGGLPRRAVFQGGLGGLGCDLMASTCNLNVTVVLGQGAVFTVFQPGFNFQWNPTDFLTVGNDHTIAAVNTSTWFKITPSLGEAYTYVTGFHPCGVVEALAIWTPRPEVPGVCCFGDETGPFPFLADWPWTHTYEFSSYGQSAESKGGDPAFNVQTTTFWDVEIWWSAWRMCGWFPCPCAGGVYDEPVPQPVCEEKKVPVRQVVSVLVPGPLFGVPFGEP